MPYIQRMTQAPVILSPSAIERIKKLLAKQPYGSVFRIAVSGGGCSGFSYDFSIQPTPEVEDIVIQQDGVTVVVDALSVPFIENSQLEFVDDLMGTYFRMVNPHATASCGCGTSFSVM